MCSLCSNTNTDNSAVYSGMVKSGASVKQLAQNIFFNDDEADVSKHGHFYDLMAHNWQK